MNIGVVSDRITEGMNKESLSLAISTEETDAIGSESGSMAFCYARTVCSQPDCL